MIPNKTFAPDEGREGIVIPVRERGRWLQKNATDISIRGP